MPVMILSDAVLMDFFHISQALSILRCGRAVGAFCAWVNGERFADCFFRAYGWQIDRGGADSDASDFLLPFA